MASMVRDLGTTGGTRVEETHHKTMESAVKGKARLVEPAESLGQTAMIGGSQPSHALLGTCSRPWIDIPLNVNGSRIEKIRIRVGSRSHEPSESMGCVTSKFRPPRSS